MTTSPALRGAVAVVALVLLGSGCTGDEDDADGPRVGSQTTSAYAEAECPREITVAMLGEVTCGTLTVPENRAEGTGQVQLFATTLVPPGGLESETPVLVLGLDTAPNYGGIAPLAQRTRSTVIILEPRGSARSVPSLACEPEVPPVTWRDRTGSPEWQQAIGTWTEDCVESLTAQGIDIAAYGVDEMAADAVDLLDAMAVDETNVISYGSGSRVVLEIMRSHSDRLRAVVLDTPELPGVDHRRYAADSTRAALEQVLSWCEADSGCRKRYPDPTTLLERALDSTDADPLTLRVRAPTGPEPTLLDAALLVRLARQTTTDGGGAGTWALPTALPRVLQAVVDGDRRALATALGQVLGDQGSLCPGYRPKCSLAHAVTEGAAATVLCGDVATPASRPGTAPALPGFREVYNESWSWGRCDSWPAAPGDPAGPVTSDVPTLVFAGGLADIPVDTVREELAGLSNSSMVVVPTGAHNVIGSGCGFELRNQWLRDLQPIANTPPCINERLEW